MTGAPDAELVDADDPGDHDSHRGRIGMALIAREVRDLLVRLEAGTPGFAGPCYTRLWMRADMPFEGE